MNKILSLLVLIMIAHTTLAQEISPYFPNPFVSTSSNPYETQITYFDLNFVSLKLQDFMSRQGSMTLKDTKYNLKEGKGGIKLIYIDKIAINTEPSKLVFDFDVFEIGNDLAIEKLKITGNADRVLKFYVSYWSTSLNFDEVSSKETVSNKFFQDRVSYSLNNGSSLIMVTNTSVNSIQEFIDDYKVKRSKYDLQQEERNIELEKKKAERIANKKKLQEENELKRNTKIKTYRYTVIKKNKKLKLEFDSNQIKDKYTQKVDFQGEITEFMKEKKVGTYKILAVYTLEYEELKKIGFDVIKYEKPKSLLQSISY